MSEQVCHATGEAMTDGSGVGTNGITLLPCPFCGGEAEIVETEHAWYLNIEHGNTCFFATEVDDDWTKAKAVEAWNTRTAVTDHDFAMAVHDGELWCKCSECKERRGRYLDAETIERQQERIAQLEELIRDMYLTWKLLDLKGDWPTSGHNGWKTFEGRARAAGLDVEGCPVR